MCIAAVFALLVGFCIQVTRTIDSPAGWVNLALTGLTAYVATDAMSGVVHWAGDTIGHDRIWFVGPNFIRPFREHHFDQKAITGHDFIETNGNNCIVIAGPLILAYLLSPGQESFGFFVATFVAFMALFVLATNQFHKWAHVDHPPALARRLQRWGLILSPRHHEIHHAVPHDKHYCITVGWMNPLLNGARFFRVAEWMIGRVRPGWLHIEERGQRGLPVTATGLVATTGGSKNASSNPAASSSGLPAPTP
jgi:plasmanylethanolamine desaturase